MRVLLDTHIMLWALVADPRLPRAAIDLIADAGNDIHVSAASIWEVAVKHALARGTANDMPISGPEALAHCDAAGYDLLSITPAHAAAVSDLPMLHRDPFDRMLVAQALLEPMRLITHDGAVKAYDANIILV